MVTSTYQREAPSRSVVIEGRVGKSRLMHTMPLIVEIQTGGIDVDQFDASFVLYIKSKAS